MSTGAADEAVPSELITAVVNLVGTGPVPLGAYTPAEIFSVGGLIGFLEAQPSHEAIAEAVRSLAARDMISTEPARTTSRFAATSELPLPSSSARAL